MAVKTVVEVEVKDAPFKAFQERFNEYTAKLGLTPGQWGEANIAIAAVGAAFAAQTEILGRLAQKQRDYTQEVRRSALVWSDINTASRRVYDNIIATTTAILRWTGAGAIFSGLLGAGGLFGLDKLAGSVSGTRRAAQGVGATYGEQRAFGSTFGRYIDTDQLTGAVNASLTDPSKYYGLIGAGAKSSDIQSGDAIKIAASILPYVRKLARDTPLQLLGPALAAHQLQDYFSVESARRLGGLSNEEFGSAQARLAQRSGEYDVGDPNARKFQDFLDKLDAAGNKVESVLVEGLARAAVPLGGLATSLATDVAAVLKNPAFARWLDQVSDSLGQAATYLGGPDFIQQLKDFTDSFGFIIDKVKGWAADLGFVANNAGPIAAGAGAGALVGGPVGAVLGAAAGALGGAANAAVKAGMASDLDTYGYTVDPVSGSIIQGNTAGSRRNNPLNIRNRGGTGFQSYATPEAGIVAGADLLKKYENVYGKDTIASIIARWAPPNENDTAAYIRDVAKRTGFDPTAHLDLSDPNVLAKLVSAISRHEGGRQQYTPGQVVTILNNTGGNTIVQTSQAAPPQ